MFVYYLVWLGEVISKEYVAFQIVSSLKELTGGDWSSKSYRCSYINQLVKAGPGMASTLGNEDS